eukprot:365907-Chlamydomonas_euryale.AAC.16
MFHTCVGLPRRWGFSAYRRLKNVVVVAEWVPDASQLQLWGGGKGETPVGVFRAARRLLIRGGGDKRNFAQFSAHCLFLPSGHLL